MITMPDPILSPPPPLTHDPIICFQDDCQQFPTPCPDIDKGWWGGNATHMPTTPFPPDNNAHEGACSGDWTLGMISDEVVIPKDIAPGEERGAHV